MLFSILGPLDVRRADGSPVSVGGPRSRTLLALLLLETGQIVGAERLIDGMYGEEPPAGAANALQSQVSRLRRGLRDEGVTVEFHPAGYRLALDREDVDAHRFERLARDGREQLKLGDHARARALLREALDLWRGAALADVPYAEAQATRLEELRVTTVEEHAEAALAIGDHPIDELRELVTAHPLRERARGLLMRALYGGGRQAEALAQYEEARLLLAEELGADPSPELAEVHLAVLRGEPSLTVRTPPPNTLPAQLTSFVGREEDLLRIGKLLSAARLVTLLGPGGAGKTRLAIEAGGQEAGEVCFVDLAPLTDGTEVPSAVLSALSLREAGPLSAGGPSDIVVRLVASLADRPILIILDNCEHVIDDAARLVHRLLGACPGLRVLATSREALGITGESMFPVPRLALPPADAAPPDLAAAPAVRLFIDRATAVRPGAELDLEMVGRICAALDGLPLAIELAAARLRSLPLADVAARLNDRFRLLSRGDRTAAPRHQTLRAVVEWSWDLLTEEEQTLARRLAVFTGGATLDAAERVCGLPDTDELLADLADKSLVEDAGGRYRMLDTIAVFCAEKLTESGEEDALRRAHAAYFLELAQTAEPLLLRAEQLDWLARLNACHGNLLATARWARHADYPLALRMVASLATYWWMRGLRTEGTQLASELLSEAGPPDGLEEEYTLCGLLAEYGGEDVSAYGLDDLLRDLAVNGRPRPILSVLWALTSGPGGPDGELQERALRDDPWLLAIRRLGWGYAKLLNGDPAGAEAEFTTGVEAFRALGERWGVANLLTELAQVVSWRGDRAEGLAMLAEGQELLQQLGSVEEIGVLLCRRAAILIYDGDLVAARAECEQSLAYARRSGAAELSAEARRGLGTVARLTGDLAEARRQFELALADTMAPDLFASDSVKARTLLELGRISPPAEAGPLFDQALALCRKHGEILTGSFVAEAVADVALAEGDGERAAVLLGAAVALRGTPIADDLDVTRITSAIDSLIGENARAAGYARGAAMSHDAALSAIRPH